MLQTVNDTGYGPGHSGFRIGNTVAHGIAGPDLYRDACFPAQLLQLIDKRNHEAVKIGPGDIFQVAAGNNTGCKGILDGAQIIVHALLPGHLHLLEDVVIGAGNQNAGLLDAQILYQLEVFLAGADPAGDFRELQVQTHALFQSFPVLLAVNKEFGLADNAVGAAQLIQKLIDVDNLVNAVGFHALLAVSKRGIGDPNLLRHSHGHPAMVECHLGDSAVGINVTLKIRLGHILQ